MSPRPAGPPTTTKTFRLPDDLIERAEAAAEAERRTLTSLVVVALEAYLDRPKGKK